MSDNDIRLLMNVMDTGFKRVEKAIETSRKEREAQVCALHRRVSSIAENGCAHRGQHESALKEISAKVDSVMLSEAATSKKDLDYPRKDQKEFDLGIGRALHGTWKGYGMREICAIILMAGFVTVAIIYARGFMKMRTEHTQKTVQK